MPARRGPSRSETYLGLRDQSAQLGEMSADQALYLAAFLAHVLEREMAVYVASVSNGRSLRVRVFNGDDKYEDNLSLTEDWGPVFGAYAKVLGGEREWQVRVGALRVATSPAAPGGAEDAQAGVRVGSGPSRRS